MRSIKSYNVRCVHQTHYPAFTAVRPNRNFARSHSLRNAAPASVLESDRSVRAPPSKSEIITGEASNNITDYIYEKIGVNLHHQPNHPIGIIKQAIYDYFEASSPGTFSKLDDLYPVVTTTANFDEMLVPPDHVSRSPNDTYYVSSDKVLRCHTSAHQAETLRKGLNAFLVTGDVYRRDSIDATHYPVFHQMEGVRVFSETEWSASGLDATEFAARDLKATLEGLAKHLFGNVECRWLDTYFPFTEPSYELEIFFNGKWLEVLGCGVMQQTILDKNYKPGHRAWAFGLGLERLAMVLFDVPDIRLFWSGDERFLSQFKAGDLKARFKPYSKFPPCYKDMAFWTSPEFSENNLCELVRGIGGDLVEEVVLIDSFTSPKNNKTSNCYRITYRSMNRSLTDEEINALQDKVRADTAEKLKVQLR
ncbi:hypothetical protein CEUSTIGMA_g7961.t1 [Chlamydomonas eustigma]|uniref:phenylalanine--tRNA ligase n=1 Tax=Chlamydomonas eustigma TaxID=1157962 RepID=A0A250XBR8_9CHLO|nr:hypothetical protein CEUSTIGMA_g7961.t1 [Chlamydomonas eustigma]|eukprot:GAX80523.1 hypothetical protein CEUSTIGMA_g7961.t1 [Chlamydomonas eustigma]